MNTSHAFHPTTPNSKTRLGCRWSLYKVVIRGGGDYDSVLVGDAPCTVGEYLPEECIEGDGEDSEEEVMFTRDQHRAT
jgi:hypothetical protein